MSKAIPPLLLVVFLAGCTQTPAPKAKPAEPVSAAANEVVMTVPGMT